MISLIHCTIVCRGLDMLMKYTGVRDMVVEMAIAAKLINSEPDPASVDELVDTMCSKPIAERMVGVGPRSQRTVAELLDGSRHASREADRLARMAWGSHKEPWALLTLLNSGATFVWITCVATPQPRASMFLGIATSVHVHEHVIELAKYKFHFSCLSYVRKISKFTQFILPKPNRRLLLLPVHISHSTSEF